MKEVMSRDIQIFLLNSTGPKVISPEAETAFECSLSETCRPGLKIDINNPRRAKFLEEILFQNTRILTGNVEEL